MFYRHIHAADIWLDCSGHVMWFQHVYSICLYLDLSEVVIAPLRTQTNQIALQLVTHSCLSPFKVSKDNSIQLDMQICCYLNKSETGNVFYSSMCFHNPSFWNFAWLFSPCPNKKCALVILRCKQQPLSGFIVKASFSTLLQWLSADLEIWCALITCSRTFLQPIGSNLIQGTKAGMYLTGSQVYCTDYVRS